MVVSAKVEHLTVSEREARGRAARSECPRSSHAVWKPPRQRRDPIDLLLEQAETRVSELIPIRHGRMAASPFAFFRGAAYIMAADLATTTRTGFEVQLCGDAHLSNFGVFAAPDRRLVFDLNDFDETLPGPWEWDVKRLVASFGVAGRERGLDKDTRRSVVMSAASRYRLTMRDFAKMRNVDVWNARLDVDETIARLRSYASKATRRRTDRGLAKARRKDSLHAFSKLTTKEGGEPRLISDPPLIVPLRELYTDVDPDEGHRALHELLQAYRQTVPDSVRHLLESYRYVDAARKVVGVGSVGTRAYIALLLGRDDADPMFLQVKEAQASVLESYTAPSAYENAGQRVVEGQRLMQAAGDIALGWIRSGGVDGIERDFYVRQLWDSKGSVEVEEMEPRALEIYGHLCGWTLARAHARTGDRVAIARYLGSGANFDRAMADFTEAYVDQNERDHASLVEAIDSGRVAAESGV
jgi:uncharacterized protein (DUF2252 family)